MKLNFYEKISLLFVGGFSLCIFIFLINLALHQGWFESKKSFYVVVSQVEGIYPGTKVQAGGLRLGKVTRVESLSSNEFKLYFNVFKKYEMYFNESTQVGFVRPFIVGERVLDVISSDSDSKLLIENSKVNFVDNFDFLEAMSGKNVGPYLDETKDLLANITYLAKEFSNRQRSEDLVEIFDQLKPLVTNANRVTVQLDKMARQMTRKDNLQQLVENLVISTDVINTSINEIAIFAKKLPDLGESSSEVMANMAELTKHLNALIPTIEAIAPELPMASKQALEALSEAVVVLKAMQKSFMLSGSVRQVRKDMKKNLEKEKKRSISSEEQEDEK